MTDYTEEMKTLISQAQHMLESALEQTGAIKILLFLLKEGPTHTDEIHKGSNVNVETMSNTLKVLTETGLITQVIFAVTSTHVQELTSEGRLIAEHLREIGEIHEVEIHHRALTEGTPTEIGKFIRETGGV